MSTQRIGNSKRPLYGATAETTAVVSDPNNERGDGRFQALSKDISTKIFKITSNANILGRDVKKIGTKDDIASLQAQMHNTQQATNSICAEVTELIRQLCLVADDKTQSLQADRLKTSFRLALERYRDVQASVQERLRSAALISQSQSSYQEEDTWSDEAALLEKERRKEQLQQQISSIEEEVNLAREREEHIRQIEGDVLDVNQIFKDLGSMITDQGEVIDTIEANITTAADHVEAGQGQLVKAAEYQKSYRKKLCCLAAIVITILGVLGLVLGLTLKKTSSN